MVLQIFGGLISLIMLRVFTTFIALFGSQCVAVQQSPKVVEQLEWPVERPLSILMISGFFPSHLYSMLGLGEELTKRGHNVTLCTTIMEGSIVVPTLPEKLGINFLSAGADNLTKKDFDYVMSLFETPGWDIIRDFVLPAPWQWSSFKVLQKVMETNMDDFDILVNWTLYLSLIFRKKRK